MNKIKNLQTDLILKCKQNDPKAQMELYDRYCNAMFYTAYNFVKKEDVAQDIMQEAFIKAFKNIESFNENGTFGSWLKRIVVNGALDWLKKRKIEMVRIEDEEIEIEEEENDDWKVEETVNLDLVHECIELLPAKYKNVLKLFLLEGYDHKEISQILQITEVSSRSQLLRGKNKLKELIKTGSDGKRYQRNV
ncbi:MAG: RNA polymerase subunit sigma-70 [Flavobacteriia bacterium]|nr:MAG: RNA polymerase subunit sigma-70 [Flavobacteriia bacterium]